MFVEFDVLKSLRIALLNIWFKIINIFSFLTIFQKSSIFSVDKGVQVYSWTPFYVAQTYHRECLMDVHLGSKF